MKFLTCLELVSLEQNLIQRKPAGLINNTFNRKTILYWLNLFYFFYQKKNIYPKKKYVEKVISLIKERAFFISDFWVIGAFFFEAPRSFDQKASRKKWKENTGVIMNDLAHVILSVNNFTSSNIESK